MWKQVFAMLFSNKFFYLIAMSWCIAMKISSDYVIHGDNN